METTNLQNILINWIRKQIVVLLLLHHTNTAIYYNAPIALFTHITASKLRLSGSNVENCSHLFTLLNKICYRHAQMPLPLSRKPKRHNIPKTRLISSSTMRFFIWTQYCSDASLEFLLYIPMPPDSHLEIAGKPVYR